MDADLLEWVLLSPVVNPLSCPSVSRVCVYFGRKVEALGGRKKEKEAGY